MKRNKDFVVASYMESMPIDGFVDWEEIKIWVQDMTDLIVEQARKDYGYCPNRDLVKISTSCNKCFSKECPDAFPDDDYDKEGFVLHLMYTVEKDRIGEMDED